MSVITNKHDDLGNQKTTQRCSICRGHLFFPFIRWWGMGADLFFCANCCAVNKDGLTADLVQVVAIDELQKAGQSKFTLVRKNIATLEKEQEEIERIERREGLRPVK